MMGKLFYDAPPTVARFAESEAFGRIIGGPVGSGKTTGCIMDLLRRAIEQKPGADGLSYTRFSVVRQTLKQLKDTVLQDCRTWLSGLGDWKVSDSTFYLSFDRVRSEWVFIPLEDADDQARLLSMQLTGGWASECIEMDISILGPLSGRMGRYPNGERGVPTWHGIIADTNLPTEMTPWHEFMTNPPKDWQVFLQPSGLAPDAENLNWLLQNEETIKLPIDHPARLAQGRKYYERFVRMYGENSDWVKRYVYAQYGDDPSGLAVYRQSFQPSFHITDEQPLINGYPILVGQDFGRNPWSVICQPDYLGRLIVHEEVAAENIGLEKHIQQNLRPRLLSDKYLGFKVCLIGDPAGIAKDAHSEENSFDLIKRCGLPCFPAPTNDLDPRLRAVEAMFHRQVNGGPAIMINRDKCPILIRGLAGGYRFVKTKLGPLKPKPDKNEFSHVNDALQYVALVVHGGQVDAVARHIRPRVKAKRDPMSPSAWT